MPHLQDQPGNGVSVGPARGMVLMDSASNNSSSIDDHLPIKEARKGYLGTSDPVVAMANKNKMTSEGLDDSFDSTDESLEARATSPTGNRTSKSVITPSPSAHSHSRTPKSPTQIGKTDTKRTTGSPNEVSNKSGGAPVLTIYGNRRLHHSPIRVKRRVSHSEDDEDEVRAQMSDSPPTHLRYGGESPVETTRPVLIRRGSSVGKRSVSEDQNDSDDNQGELPPALKKAKTAVSNNAAFEEAVEAASAIAGMKKKPIISPASSGDKAEDDEVKGCHRLSSHDKRSQHVPYYHPHPPPYQHIHHSGSYGYGGHVPGSPSAAYPMYHGFPPFGPPPHFMGGHMHPAHPHPASAGFYPPYHQPSPMMHHYHQRPQNLPTQPHLDGPSPATVAGLAPPKATLSSGSIDGKPVKTVPAKTKATESRSDSAGTFKSVSDWQQATLSSGGKPPSANRCIPLKEPIPSKYWGEAEKTKDVALQDFHRLVNYPDYLSKAKGDSNSPDGKKNCVMCGKLRICSASSLVHKGRNDPTAAKTEELDDTSHIIPRQNKGLCTACDVTVWVVTSDGLEIKWCKGCKNFRPWAAFGDKGSATKCVRCRERQREKYAMQKDEMRSRRYKRGSSTSPSSESSSGYDTKKEEEPHLAAAQGLRSLMNAATSV